MGEGPLSLLCLGRHRRHSRDIYHAFPLRFCMLRAIKNWTVGSLGTRQRLNRCQPLQEGLPIHWLAYNTGKAAALEFTFLWGCLFVWVLINVKFVIKLDACIYFMLICYGCYYPDFIELCTRFKGACSTTTPYTHTGSAKVCSFAEYQLHATAAGPFNTDRGTDDYLVKKDDVSYDGKFLVHCWSLRLSKSVRVVFCNQPPLSPHTHSQCDYIGRNWRTGQGSPLPTLWNACTPELETNSHW